MTISEQQLPCQSFSRKDAVFVTDGIQVEFLKAASNASLGESLLLPLSLHAYAAILKVGHARVRSYFGYIDFVEFKRWYCKEGLGRSRTWLKELKLKFQIDGIDIAELDAACQFQLFAIAICINGTAERIIRANPEIETFYVLVTEQRLPLDFYFDSDVPAASLRFVCERLGRPLRTIVMKQRPRYVFPWPCRPVMNWQDNRMIFDQEMLKINPSSRPQVGFAPSTVADHRQIHDAIRKLSSSVLICPTVWEMPQAFYDRRPESDEVVYRLSTTDGEWSAAVSAQLAELRRQFFERRSLSTIPSCVIRNPHLDFQFDYIFTRRWLAYANMIRRAARFVASTPLDLFIHSDCFTPEGAILARLYRRRGTRVIVVLHSGWPVDPDWGSWDSSDSAIVPSKTSADRIRELSGMSNVFVTGPLDTCTYRSLLHGAVPPENKRRAHEHRKIVLIVTNASEVNCFPVTALDSHFDTLSFLGRIPESLKDRVLLAIRTKPGGFEDGSILYKELSGFPSESLTFLDGLDFSQCISVADCAVGINLPTSGYFEVLRKGVPLIHLQTADVVSFEPDLPSEVIPRITEIQAIWPAIEALLFDEQQRRKLLKIQERFVRADFEPTVSGHGNPVETLLRQMLEARKRPTLRGFLSGVRGQIVRRFRPTRRYAPLDEGCLPRSEQGGAGFVQDVLLGSDGSAVIVGWAADMLIRQPAKAVHVFLDGLWVSKSSLSQSRPDVALHFNDGHLEQSGFSVNLTLGREENVAALSVYAELHDGTFSKLPFFKLQQATTEKEVEQNR